MLPHRMRHTIIVSAQCQTDSSTTSESRIDTLNGIDARARLVENMCVHGTAEQYIYRRSRRTQQGCDPTELINFKTMDY
jgi:hypothetical protein